MATEVAREAKGSNRRSAKQDRGAAAPAAEAKVKSPQRTAATGSGHAEHVVFLVPGLLGFENFATFTYFADRVVAALRAGLEQSLGQPVPVVAVPIPPTASLRERQRRLIKTLADRLHALEHGQPPLHVHLVGHSTGGVDADLLTCAEPVDGGPWADLDPRADALRARIRSVVSIASPHQGACLVLDPVARILSQRDPRGLPDLVGLLGAFLASAASDMDAPDFVTSLKREGAKTWRFLRDLRARWELLEDLEPTRVPTRLERDIDVHRRSFVTVSGRPRQSADAPLPADAFFRALSTRAAGWSSGCAERGELVSASLSRVNEVLSGSSSSDRVIKAAGTELPAQLDAGHNDGVVNAARQLIDPTDAQELAAIVVGDHFDVVGYYDRRIWIVDDEGHERSKRVVSGLLHSGSGFRDREFFELYRRVSQVIADAARNAATAAQPVRLEK